ncbi:serine/threonine protein kinase, CMGC, dual-specificity [Ophidiomyces ophidiicola]|nr:serine/threonine protein kinase, CMGC, dual-specificity [Ophidiomyces ophidiicola]KAI1967711.1 serine/threonine protein kinase, CMGC, dual-specificity [Ophidiomyces ophidiicola]KAI2068246.1 serine/threonine protein kinase, CMGC, dual-specificity [Ophidiomyces ophidiicola]KAI2086185.1 serine/threonine protein kinase, CMGC, dual-specificity [Ophidiomyces ophidiicola]KAI2112126.1 serine/threonine protein kinase, CMGC, dual-specificity [Ophidiomyces ophidiicola]
MLTKTTSQRPLKASQSRMSLSDQNDSSSSGVTFSPAAEVPLRKTLQKTSASAAIPRSHPYDAHLDNAPASRRRRSILERSSTFGSRDANSSRRTVSTTFTARLHSSNLSIDSADSPSRTQSTTSSSTAKDENETASENGEFLAPISFDDFHNSISSKEPSLSHFPLPGHGGAGYEAKAPASSNRWTMTAATQSAKEPRSAGSARRLSNATRSNAAVATSKPSTSSALPAGRARRQSYAPPVPTNVTTPRRPRKSIGPGSLISDVSDRSIPPVRKPSFSRKKTTDQSHPLMNTDAQNLSSTSLSHAQAAIRSQKARSLQPPSRALRDNLGTTSTMVDHSTSAPGNVLRTPVKCTAGKTSTSSSSKRTSIMPPHATGLGARTISPTDARRMKRMSLIPHPPPLPGNSPTHLELGFPRPRSSVQSPSAIPRKSVTPSSNRTTPDPHRKSYSSGISLSSNTSYNSARNSNGSLQARLSQNVSSSRLPTPKPRLENNRNGEDDVPPVPAIPKAYESPKNEQNLSFTPRKSSLPLDAPNFAETPKVNLENEPTPSSNEIFVAKRTNDETSIKEVKARPPVNLSKKNLQPLKLPPLNLLPLSAPINTKIDALCEKASQDSLPQASATPQRPANVKTPSTPLTASKANFFHAFPAADQTRSNTSHFSLRTDFSKFRVENSSSAFDTLELPHTRNISPYISSSLPRGREDIAFMRNQASDTYSRGVSGKLAASRPQTQISSLSNVDMFNFGLTPDGAETDISFPPPSPQRHDDRVSSKTQPISESARDPVKVDGMPPPKLPASATWSGISGPRVSPTTKQSPLRSKRSTSICNLVTLPSPRRHQSISSDQSAPVDPNLSADSGDAEVSTNRSSSSILSPVHKLLSSAKSSPTYKSRVQDPNIDRDDMAAEEEMRKLGSKCKDFEVAAKALEDLRRRASPKERASSSQALKVANLNIFERGEIIDFKDIYFCGTHKAKKLVGDLNASTANFGYDDDRGDYNIVIGDHLAYRYEIVDVLGKGSFGQVVRCVDHKTGTLVAVKIIRNKKRFHQQALVEVNILQKLKEWDPNRRHSVVDFVQSFYFRGHLCISTELLGINLYEFIKAHDFRGFSLKLIRRFTKQILSTLVLLHTKRVVHCDLKPENILLVNPLQSGIRVIDFGSSCFENEKVYTYIQSRFYRSPEVILGMSYGMPIDMWSLGCILAELFTGYPLFPGENEQEQLACIMEVFGPPEKHVIEKSTRRKLFFDSTGKPRDVVSSKGRRRKPSSKNLRHVLKCDDAAFLDFLARCLRWDPARRLSPHDAMNHEFVTGMKFNPRSRSHLTSMSHSLGKRHTSGTTPGVRPLPEPPSKQGFVRTREASSNSPVRTGLAKRQTAQNITSTATTKRASNAPPSASGSALPRVTGRNTSGKPDLAAAAAASSLSHWPHSRPMKSFGDHGLDEDAFGDKQDLAAGLRTFDAFPKTKPTYTTATRRGGQWTVLIVIFCGALVCSELVTWYRGTENQHFSVEKGVSHEIQMNLDAVVRMPCDAIRVDMQDAAGDMIFAGQLLHKEPTSWDVWNRELNFAGRGGSRQYQTLSAEDNARLSEQEEDQHVGHVLGEVRRSRKRQFPKGPKIRSHDTVDSCRLYGSLEGNKVQGNFHITARGFGYFDIQGGVELHQLNFTHLITELSFGPHYSTLMNPLDKTMASTEDNFYRYQYYMSVVPTIYTRAGTVDPYSQRLPDPSTITPSQRRNTIFTNQYAVTSQSRLLPKTMHSVPGIFFKFDIEPILLVISEERGSFLALLVRLVNVVSGVLVAGGWMFQLTSWAVEVWGKKRRGANLGMLGNHEAEE